MQVYKLAKVLGMTSKELIAELDGIDHHADNVPNEIADKMIEDLKETPLPEIIEQPKETETVSITPEVQNKPKEPVCPVDLATIELSIRCAGNKSPYWKYKNLLEG